MKARAASTFRPGLWPKHVSAMLRVKNEDAFLHDALASIVDLVDEVVVVDHASTDGTPEIIAAMARAHPRKIRAFHYPHAIARVGEENRALLESEEGRRSPHLLSNYYNWCLARCRMNYVLKWDGDMIATPAFTRQLRAFQRSRCLYMRVYGANVHPDGIHLVGATTEQQREIQAQMPEPTSVGNWTGPYTDPESRICPRRGATFANDFWWCESLRLPMPWGGVLETAEPGYLHMKYCKPNPYENFSTSFEDLIRRGVVPGPAIDPELRAYVARVARRSPA